jgi:hypothetical protein
MSNPVNGKQPIRAVYLADVASRTTVAVAESFDGNRKGFPITVSTWGYRASRKPSLRYKEIELRSPSTMEPNDFSK